MLPAYHLHLFCADFNHITEVAVTQRLSIGLHAEKYGIRTSMAAHMLLFFVFFPK